MSIVYAVKLMSDLYCYLAIVGLLGLLKSTCAALTALPLLFGLGAGVGYGLSARGDRMRMAPLALGLAAIPFGFGRLELLLALPAAVYSVMYVRGNRRATDYYYAFERFKYELPLVVLALVHSILSGGEAMPTALPALFLFLALTILLLRMLRHDDRVIKQRRFQMLNLAGLLGACAAGAALSTDAVLGAVLAALRLLRDWVLYPILTAVAWTIGKLLWLVGLFAELFASSGTLEDVQPANEISMESFSEKLAFEPEQAMSNPALRIVLSVLGIAALCAAAFFVLRALSKHAQRDNPHETREERERIDVLPSSEGGIAAALRRRKDGVLAVRHVYARYLSMAQGRGVPLNGCQTSAQIRDLSQETFDREALDALRAAYIRARYDGDADADSLAQAKDAFSRLKQK